MTSKKYYHNRWCDGCGCEARCGTDDVIKYERVLGNSMDDFDREDAYLYLCKDCALEYGDDYAPVILLDETTP